VSQCDREFSTMRRPQSTGGLLGHGKKLKNTHLMFRLLTFLLLCINKPKYGFQNQTQSSIFQLAESKKVNTFQSFKLDMHLKKIKKNLIPKYRFQNQTERIIFQLAESKKVNTFQSFKLDIHLKKIKKN